MGGWQVTSRQVGSEQASGYNRPLAITGSWLSPDSVYSEVGNTVNPYPLVDILIPPGNPVSMLFDLV